MKNKTKATKQNNSYKNKSSSKEHSNKLNNLTKQAKQEEPYQSFYSRSQSSLTSQKKKSSQDLTNEQNKFDDKN